MAPLSTAPTAEAQVQYRAQRNDLGEAFGTRKAKSQIKAQERGKVNAAAMEGVKDHLMESIVVNEETEGESLNRTNSRKLTAVANGPSAFIPVPNMTTDDVTRVYPRESIVPSAEWAVIDVKPFIKAKDEKERLVSLPSRHSAWVNNKLGEVIRGPAELRKDNMYAIPLPRRTELMFSKYLYYLSMLQEFSRKLSKVAELKPSEMGEQFPGVPSQIITGLLDRFTEKSGKKYTITDSRKTKIMAWQCVLYLTIDGWSTDISKVATDLKVKPPKSVFPNTLLR